MENPEIIAIVVIALVLGGAIAYIVKAKKSGRKCIGCPSGGKCQGSCNSCNCHLGTCNKDQDSIQTNDEENNDD